MWALISLLSIVAGNFRPHTQHVFAALAAIVKGFVDFLVFFERPSSSVAVKSTGELFVFVVFVTAFTPPKKSTMVFVFLKHFANETGSIAVGASTVTPNMAFKFSSPSPSSSANDDGSVNFSAHCISIVSLTCGNSEAG